MKEISCGSATMQITIRIAKIRHRAYNLSSRPLIYRAIRIPLLFSVSDSDKLVVENASNLNIKICHSVINNIIADYFCVSF